MHDSCEDTVLPNRSLKPTKKSYQIFSYIVHHNGLKLKLNRKPQKETKKILKYKLQEFGGRGWGVDMVKMYFTHA